MYTVYMMFNIFNIDIQCRVTPLVYLSGPPHSSNYYADSHYVVAWNKFSDSSGSDADYNL